MNGGRRVFITALLFSLGVHLLLAGHAAHWWTLPTPEIPFAIEAHLMGAASPTSTPSPPARPRQPPPKAEANPAVMPEPAPDLVPEAPVARQAPVDTFEPAPAPSAQTSSPSPDPIQEQSAAVVPAVAPTTAQTPLAKLQPPAQRELPSRLTLRYTVRTGEGGFNVGQATYTWTVRDGRYSLISIAEAKGIASLFISGKIIQTSEGEVTPYGLRPNQFWMVKGDRRQAPVQFDWVRKQLALPGGGLELPDQTQDLLSFPFHLAMTLRDDDEERHLPVTNGRKLREYGFRAVGHEMVQEGETRFDSLHLHGERAGEGSLDVWLAPSSHWLPVRIRTLDQKGKTIVLTLEHVDLTGG